MFHIVSNLARTNVARPSSLLHTYTYSSQLVTPSQLPFDGILSTYIIQRLVEMESSTDDENLSLALSEMKSILMRMVPDLRRRGHTSDEMLPVMSYMVMPKTGPTVKQASVAVSTWRLLTPEETRNRTCYLGKAEIKDLGTDFLQKV